MMYNNNALLSTFLILNIFMTALNRIPLNSILQTKTYCSLVNKSDLKNPR